MFFSWSFAGAASFCQPLIVDAEKYMSVFKQIHSGDGHVGVKTVLIEIVFCVGDELPEHARFLFYFLHKYSQLSAG